MKKIHVCICCFHDVEIWLGKNCPILTRSLLLRHYCYNLEVDNGSFNVFHCVISFVVESRWFAWHYYPPQINFRRHEKNNKSWENDQSYWSLAMWHFYTELVALELSLCLSGIVACHRGTVYTTWFYSSCSNFSISWIPSHVFNGIVNSKLSFMIRLNISSGFVFIQDFSHASFSDCMLCCVFLKSYSQSF